MLCVLLLLVKPARCVYCVIYQQFHSVSSIVIQVIPSHIYHHLSLSATTEKMSQGQQGGGVLLDVLKKKMRALKEELEMAQEMADESKVRVNDEIRRREEVCVVYDISLISGRWANF